MEVKDKIKVEIIDISYDGLGVAKVADTALLNSSFSEIMVGIVILMLVGCEFFIHYSIKFRHNKKEGNV